MWQNYVPGYLSTKSGQISVCQICLPLHIMFVCFQLPPLHRYMIANVLASSMLMHCLLPVVTKFVSEILIGANCQRSTHIMIDIALFVTELLKILFIILYT